jgi:OOP family OmpA-OmpF porin
MRLFLVFCISIVSYCTFGQYSEYNKWSVDLSIGGTNAVEPYTPGYWSNTVDLVHTSGGVRYMFNNKFGLKLDVGYDLISNDKIGKNGNSLPFKTNYYRSSFQGVLDIGRIFTFENFTDRWSLLFHTGGGMSLTSSKINPEKDKMVNFLFGFTPQFKINDRIALNVDASFIWHIYQQYTFDMYNSVYNRGFDGFLANATVGVNIYLGKKKQHCDWAYTPCFPDMSYLEVENKKKDSVINLLKLDLTDSDGDGVINISDDEKETPLGNKVNCRGVSLRNIDSDGDGVNDLIDKCPENVGKPELSGCPEELISKNNISDDNNGNKGNDNNGNQGNDNNGNQGNDNNGNKGNDNNGNQGNDNNGNQGNDNNGNKGNESNDKKIISKDGFSTLADVNFDLNQSTLKTNFTTLLNEVVYLLKQESSTKILIDGHTDITGEENFNTKLALQRAESVKKFLESKGIASDRILIGSFGETKPKYSNDTPSGRALNRRVEIMIKRN